MNKLIKSKYKSGITGFTLIEMMFLVLILGIVAVHIAQMQQQKTQQIIVERASQDILSWQTMLVNYWTANQRWPTSFSDLSSQLPPKSICSPFISDTVDTTCGTYSAYKGVSGSSGYTLTIDTGNTSLATQLASKLLNAWLTGTNMTTVNVAIPAPNQTSTYLYRGFLVSAGYATLNNSTGPNKSQTGAKGAAINLPNCPKGFEGHIMLSPIDYQSENNWGIHITMVTPNGQAYSETTSDPFVYTTDNLDIHNHNIHVVAVMDKANTELISDRDVRHLAQYLTFCVPQIASANMYQNTRATYSSNWHTNYIEQIYGDDRSPDDGGLGDGQCSTSWQQYYIYEGRTSNLDCQWNAAHPNQTFHFTDVDPFYPVPVGTAQAY